MVTAKLVRRDSPLQHKIFFMLHPPAETAARIVRLADSLSAERYLTGRRTPAARFHVSLNNLGAYAAVPWDLVDHVCGIVSAITLPSFVIAFNRVMSFGGGSGERPLVLGGDEGVIGADLLHGRIRAALEAGSLAPRHRPFEPHLTISREDGSRPERIIAPIAWRVRELRLIDSVRGEGRHDVLGSWTLED